MRSSSRSSRDYSSCSPSSSRSLRGATTMHSSSHVTLLYTPSIDRHVVLLCAPFKDRHVTTALLSFFFFYGDTRHSYRSPRGATTMHSSTLVLYVNMWHSYTYPTDCRGGRDEIRTTGERRRPTDNVFSATFTTTAEDTTAAAGRSPSLSLNTERLHAHAGGSTAAVGRPSSLSLATGRSHTHAEGSTGALVYSTSSLMALRDRAGQLEPQTLARIRLSMQQARRPSEKTQGAKRPWQKKPQAQTPEAQSGGDRGETARAGPTSGKRKSGRAARSARKRAKPMAASGEAS
jgi:hypothetical protein